MEKIGSFHENLKFTNLWTEFSVIINKRTYIRCKFQNRKTQNVMGVTGHQIELKLVII